MTHHRIVHLGLGAFARAHLALYVEDTALAGAPRWPILGVSLKRPDQRDKLRPQGWRYTALERGLEGNRARVVTILEGVLVAPEDPEAVLAAMAAPETAIVTLTITEKGYCHDPATGRLNPDHPDIAHDLAHLEAPRSAVGFLAGALARRRAASLPPFATLSCDNLPANGRVLAGLVRDFAALSDPSLAAWIAAEAAFPCSMVDRIVPAATTADEAEALRLTGIADAAPVPHEPFRQWVIEAFPGPRPDWEKAGVTMTQDVAPFEFMKLRLLNGAHSALAYLGYLAGRETIADCLADPALAAFLHRLWAEIIPTVPAPPGVVLTDYTEALAARFANGAIRHRCWQIAMDGSQKLPQRLLATVRARRAAGLPIPSLASAIAGWARYVGGVDESGGAIDVRDPLAESLRARLTAAGDDPAARIAALLAESRVFGTDLPADPVFTDAVTSAYARIAALGARAATSAAP